MLGALSFSLLWSDSRPVGATSGIWVQVSGFRLHRQQCAGIVMLLPRILQKSSDSEHRPRRRLVSARHGMAWFVDASLLRLRPLGCSVVFKGSSIDSAWLRLTYVVEVYFGSLLKRNPSPW